MGRNGANSNAAAQCRLCGAAATPAFVVGDFNRGLGPGRFHYNHCPECGVTAVDEVPADLSQYYAADEYGNAEDEFTPEQRRRELAKVELLLRFAAPGRLVEIGPGPGFFTRVAQASGFDTTAIEMDPRYSAYLKDQLGVPTIQSNAPAEVLTTLPPSRSVVMWHVIEHLPDPWAVLASCVANLQVGGVLALSTPNPASLQCRLLKGRWVHIDAPRHLQLIPLASLDAQLARHGVRRVLTATWDPTGRALSRGGWEVAVRHRRPAGTPVTLASMRLARAISLLMNPVERLDLLGAAYTAFYVREPDLAR